MKNKTLAISLISLVVLYCLLLALVVPVVVKPMVSEQAKNFIHASVELEDIDINPLTNSLSIEGLVVKNLEGKTLVSLDSAYVNLDILSLVALQLNIETLELNGLKVYAADSMLLHLPQLIANDTAIQLFSQSVTIENIAINSLKLVPVLEKNGSNIDELLAEIDKLLISEESDAAPAQQAQTNTEQTEEVPKENNDETEIEPITSSEPAATQTALDTNNTETLSDVQMEAEAAKEISVDSDAQTNTVTEETLTQESPAQEKLPQENSLQKNKEVTIEEEKPWLVLVNQFAINQASIELSDSMNSDEPLKTEITEINLNAQNIMSDFSQDAQFKLSLNLFDSTIIISGSANPISMNNAIRYDLGQINLAAANHYVESYSQANIKSGLLYSSGAIETSQTRNDENEEAVLTIKVSNNTSVKDINIAHRNFEQSLISCPLIESQNMEFNLPANSLALESFLVDQCRITVVLKKDGSSNTDLALADSKKTDDESGKTKEESSQEAPADNNMQIAVQSIKLTNNELIIKDYTQGDEVNLVIAPLNAEITDLSAGEKYKTSLSLDAKINKHAPLSIKGKGNFLNPKLSSDIQTRLDNMGLTVFTPYTLNLSSRPIEKGTLSLDIDIKIDENQLDSKNHALLAGLQLGKKQAHEGASKLPIALAVSVLRDNDGNINVDIPVKGDLDDPSFSITKQVIKVISNLITKAATAAFSMVGDAVSGENNTNAREIVFSDNTSSISPEQNKITQALATTLKAHPELALNVKAVIGQNEASLLTQEQQLTLQQERMNNFKQSMLALGALEQQIVFAQDAATIETAAQGKLELSFFAF